MMTPIIPISKKDLAVDAGPCVYFLYLGDEIIYVGQTVNLYARITAHSGREFNAFSFIPTDISDLNRVEARCIVEYKPTENLTIPPSDDYISYSRAKNELLEVLRSLFIKNASIAIKQKYDKPDMIYVGTEFYSQLSDHIMKFEHTNTIGEL